MSGRRLVRLFPLPNVVLLPETTLPLHVFEPRYRSLLADALDSNRLIGMQLLKPDGSGDDEPKPAVFSIGCAGEIVHHEELEDGRSNILLRGAFRYRIEAEQGAPTPYRLAEVTPIGISPLPPGDRADRSPRDLRRLLAMDRLEERYAWTLAHIEGVQRRLDFLSPFRRPGGDARWN